MKKILFIDRDGTICRSMPRGTYLIDPEKFELLPGIMEFLSEAKRREYKVVVITNQPQISKGIMSQSTLDEIHQKMMAQLPGLIDKIYFCPHCDEDSCLCRKPKPGMIHRGLAELEGDYGGSVVIGDSDRDILAGQAVGCRTIFLKDDQNGNELERCSPDFVAHNLIEAIDFL